MYLIKQFNKVNFVSIKSELILRMIAYLIEIKIIERLFLP